MEVGKSKILIMGVSHSRGIVNVLNNSLMDYHIAGYVYRGASIETVVARVKELTDKFNYVIIFWRC